MKVWITNGALTYGIREVGGQMATEEIFQADVGDDSYLFGTGEWYTTKDDAIARAEQMRTDAIAELQKELAKLEAMTFDTPQGAATDA